MRAFIALELPEGFVQETADLARSLSGQVAGRFSRRENYHVTLAFLGELDEAGARAAIGALDALCPGRGPIELRPCGLGTFGRPRDATLWMGLEPAPGLVELAEVVRAALAERWVEFDDKPFMPHVTLARRARLPREELSGLVFPRAAMAGRVTLFKSTLLPEGAQYKQLYTVELGE